MGEIRKEYIDKLKEYIDARPYTSYSQKQEFVNDDMGMRMINRQLDKLYNLSIPISIEIVDKES